MDSSILVMEESRSDLAASASKSAGSIVQIDSISVDINCAMEDIELKEHDHFSIREFVAGMWEKNWKMCMPFGTEDITTERSTTSENQLVVRNNANTNSHLNAEKENDGSLACDIWQTGDGNQSSYSKDDDLCNNMILCSHCTEERKSLSSRAQTDVRDDDDQDANSPAHVVEAVPLQIVERDPNSAVESPIRELENASSGSDVQGVSAAHRRRRKLRSLVDIMDEDKNPQGEKSIKGSIDAEADLEPQLSEEISKGTKSPQRKRANVHEEDRGQHVLGNPANNSKRLKSLILNAEKTSSRVQIVDVESEGGASALLNLSENAKALQIKPKKNKSVDTSRRTKKMHISGRAMQMREVPKIKEMEPHFPDFISGQQMDRISKLSMGKASVLEPQHSHLVHPNKSSLNDHNTLRGLALDLSLNSYMGVGIKSDSLVSSPEHRGIPDLNESFPERVPVMQGKELPTLSEKRSSTLLRNLEMPVSCSEDAAVLSQSQAVENVDNNVEPGGAPDDIPMDIVELMARNQRERALGNSMQQLAPEEINNSVIGSSSFYTDRAPNTANFPFTYTRGNMAVSQGVSNFPQVKNCQLSAGNLFSSFTPRQPYPTSSLGWRSNEGADLFWPPRQMNAPFHPSVKQNHSDQRCPLNLHSFSDFRYKGKSTVSGEKGNEKNTLWDASAVKEGRLRLSSKSVRSVDAYCNDTIPAMQLLSLVDQGITSSSSYKVGLNRFHDKHLSPCHNHPQMKENENKNDLFLNGSFFSPSSHSMGIARLINGVSHLQGQTLPKPGNSKMVPGTTMAQPQNNMELGVCALSRNPADFSTPDEGNEFTIGCKDLKPPNRNNIKKRTRPNNADGQKKHVARKNSRK